MMQRDQGEEPALGEERGVHAVIDCVRVTQAALEPPGELRAAPLPLRCWVPPIRAPGQDFHLRSHTSCPAYAERPAGYASATAVTAPGTPANGCVQPPIAGR